MNKNQIFKIIRIVIYSGYLLLLSLVFQYDASFVGENDKFIESSLTEYFQEGTLLLIALIFFLSTYYSKDSKALLQLLGGFYLMALVREFDSVLDHYVYDGAWQTIVLIILVILGVLIFKSRKKLASALPSYMNSFSFGLLIAGMLIAFIYNRLFGEPFMWKAVMEDGYIRSVKNAVEESVELLGYSLILFSSIEYFIQLKGEKIKP